MRRSTPVSRSRSSPRSTPLVAGVAVAIAGILAALALVHTNATGVAEVADAARAQQAAESALGSVAATRGAIGHVLLLAASDPSDEAIAAWIGEAEMLISDMVSRVESAARLPGFSSTQGDEVAAAAASGLEVLDLVAGGNPEAAGTRAASATADFEALEALLVEQRDGAATVIAVAASKAGAVATASRFFVALIVPIAGIVAGLRLIRRRRIREQQALELENERQVNQSKDRLIASLSHELRTPLTGIFTSALALEESGFEDMALSQELNSIIIQQSADLNRMVEDLLASAQAQAGRLIFSSEPVDAERELAAVVEEFRRLGHSVRHYLAPGTITADPVRLRQVMRNLISNALRHGGPNVVVRSARGAEHYTIEVMDDGPGVAAEVEKRLFEEWVHAGDRPLIVGSVGLGLAITRLLLVGMGGAISYRRQGTLTVFCVELDLAMVPSLQAAAG